MGPPIIEEVTNLEIQIVSPDESIHARLTRASGLALNFDEPLHELHTEDSLEDAIEFVINEALREYEMQVSRIRVERYGEDAVAGLATGRQRRFLELCNRIRFVAKGANNPVSIDWKGSDEIVVAVNRGSLTEFSHAEFTAATNHMIQAAFTAYSVSVNAARRMAYLDNAS